ncbi:capsular polysaccharide export protein, LipB/KpsS family [Aliarcobacter butzleri]|uniref:capsular polysaccharide export protein, LipB/KpsS family n=1 Tax=Aliarcobacter butzleri TaxID=28197 RepID=UPI000F47792A|nr:hypothetical protein [Aliarcobacter butzleri]
MKSFIKKMKSKYIWSQKAKFIERFIVKNDFALKLKEDKYVGIFISSWFGTFIPWYSIVVGLLLKKFYGRKLLFIVDDMPFSDEKLNPKFQYKSILNVTKLLEKYNEVRYLSKQDDIILDEEIVKKYAYFNTLHDIKTEQFDEQNDYYKLIENQLKDSSSKVSSILDKFDFEYIFVPGGLCFLTGILCEQAKQKEIRVCSYDSGMKGAFLLSTHGVAAHLEDIPRAVNIIRNDARINLDDIKKDVENLIDDRFRGKDIFNSQVGRSDDSIDYSNSILLPLNVNWDSAVLNKHIIFKDTIEWILETTRWILENTNKRVIIRQHPVERFDYGKGLDNYKSILENEFGLNIRIIFIGAEDKANTYDILKQTDFVITHTSTVATEAVVYGKDVITVSNVYYSKIGYVQTPKSKQDYFMTIGKLITNKQIIDESIRLKAIISYYVSQRLNWCFPEFLPSTNVDVWLNNSLDNILRMLDTNEILEAIDSDIPLPIVKWRKSIDS